MGVPRTMDLATIQAERQRTLEKLLNCAELSSDALVESTRSCSASPLAAAGPRARASKTPSQHLYTAVPRPADIEASAVPGIDAKFHTVMDGPRTRRGLASTSDIFR